MTEIKQKTPCVKKLRAVIIEAEFKNPNTNTYTLSGGTFFIYFFGWTKQWNMKQSRNERDTNKNFWHCNKKSQQSFVSFFVLYFVSSQSTSYAFKIYSFMLPIQTFIKWALTIVQVKMLHLFSISVLFRLAHWSFQLENLSPYT